MADDYKELVPDQDKRSQEFAKNPDVAVSLRDQIPKKLMKQLNDLDVGPKAVELWNRADSNRVEWLERQKKLRMEVEEFFAPLYTATMSWSSTLHYPVALTVCKTYHARMYSAVWDSDPPFTTKARKSANTDKVPVVQDLMRFAVKDWANCYKGLDAEIDAGLVNWIYYGAVFWKNRWEKKFEKFIDVEMQQKQQTKPVTDPATGQPVPTIMSVPTEVEVEKTKVTFDGPMVEAVPLEDIIVIGGNGDPDDAEHVIQMYNYTASDLNGLADQKIFDKKVVDEIIQSASDVRPTSESNRGIQEETAHSAGFADPNPSYEQDKYIVLEVYSRMPIDNTGINSDLVYWVHKQSGKILRATYLRRVSKNGQRPYSWAPFMPRVGSPYGIGIIEMIYNLAKEIDAIRNMRLDFGLLSSLPFGYYRPSSSMSTAEIPIQPGQLIPLDNPQTDVVFPNLGNRTVFGYSEEQSVYSMIERVTNMSDLSLGLLSGQGAARTATGARAVLGESNTNLNIYLRRVNRALKKMYNLLFESLQARLPEGMEFRVVDNFTGQDMYTVVSPSKIEGVFDFELDPNSANSNKQVQIDVANQIYQLTGNPLDIQLGLVSANERYEAIKNLLQVTGVRDFSRYVRKPDPHIVTLSPIEMVDRALGSADLILNPALDLQGFVALADEFLHDDHLLGQLAPDQAMRLAAKMQEAQQMMQAVQQQQAQQANANQMQQNAGMGAGQNPTQVPSPNQGAGAAINGPQQQ